MDILNYNDALTLVDQTITFSDKGTDLAAKIVKVETNAIHGDEWNAYTIVFELQNTELSLSQGILEFEYPGFEKQTILVSPNSQTEFESVVSQRK